MTFHPGEVQSGGVLIWFGQAGFVLEVGGLRLGIDLFFSEVEGRVCPRFPIESIGPLNYLLITHEHLDHFDQPLVKQLAERMPDMTVVLPEPLRGMAKEAGLREQQVVGALPDVPISASPRCTIVPIASVHGVKMEDGYSFGQPYGRFLGYCVKSGDLSIYHSGDTLAYPGLEDRLRKEKVGWALLPINGRDYYREAAGLVGNMGPGEAAELAGRAGAHTLVPFHFDGFVNNLGDVGEAVREVRERYPGLTVVVPGYAQRIPLMEPGH